MKVNNSVKNIIRTCANTSIVYDQKQINIVDALASIPRSGKSVRIDRFGLPLPKRSLLDHVLTLGHNADFFINKYGLTVDADFLANAIAFHDLSEIIIGDAPDFTAVYLAGDLHKSPNKKKADEADAETIIYSQLPTELKESYKQTIALLHSQAHNDAALFNFIDKTDSIISIWRYLHLFKNKLDIDQFVDAMDDFFANPKILPLAINPSTAAIIQFLQDKNNAMQYYNGLSDRPEIADLFENYPMHFINENIDFLAKL